MKKMPAPSAEEKYIVFKRWDVLGEAEDPRAVVFFAPPDVLSGLFTLASFGIADQQGVIAPFASGRGGIISYPPDEITGSWGKVWRRIERKG